jgi:hypothetical protein
VLDKRLREAWHARERGVPISTELNFAPEGLVLGAGTLLLRAEGPRRLQNLAGREGRVLALLSAAYGKAVAPSVLGNIERAAKAWCEGDECLAYIHLAHVGLQPLHDCEESAYRPFLAEGAMREGASPRRVLEALHVDADYIDAIEKFYNSAEPRVPAGSGKQSGEWTRDSDGTSAPSLLSYLMPGAASWLGEISATQVVELGAYAARLAGPVGAATVVFGLLFIPSPNDVHVEGEVSGVPGLRYSWNRDEALLHLTYDNPDGGQRTFALHVDGDVIRDEDGKVVGRIVGGNRIAVDAIAVLPDLVKQDEPRLCPAYAPDVSGSDQGKPYEENRARQYEDFIKRLINPPPNGPTPSGYVYYLPNPAENDKPVSFDDCEQPTGKILFEIKGEGVANLTNDIPDAMASKFVNQASRQLAASGGRPVAWIFAEEEAALFARELFDDTPSLGRITVIYVPWIKSRR